jgi:hypothetical protein
VKKSSFKCGKLNSSHVIRAAPKKLFIFFIIDRNIDFGKKYPPTVSLNGYLNVAIFYLGLLASQR